MVNLLFVHGTEMGEMMVDLSRNARECTDRQSEWEKWREPAWGWSHQRETHGQAQAVFFKAQYEAKKIVPSWGEIQVSDNAEVGAEGEGEFAANYVVEDAGQAEARWKLYPDVLDKVIPS